MTRARDALYLSWFRRVNFEQEPSPFFVAISGQKGVIRSMPRRLPPLPDTAPPAGNETPLVSFSDLAFYSDCPYAYRLRKLIGFQPPLAREIGYGNAVHHILRRIADSTIETGLVPDDREIDRIFDEEFFLPFAHKAAYLKMLSRARTLVADFVARHRGDLMQAWETERLFELHLPELVVMGRADVILARESGRDGAMAILDYKTAKHDDQTLHHRQLQLYTAAGRREGFNIEEALVMDLAEGDAYSVEVSDEKLSEAESWAVDTIGRMSEGDFGAVPGRKCGRCDVALLCEKDQ